MGAQGAPWSKALWQHSRNSLAIAIGLVSSAMRQAMLARSTVAENLSEWRQHNSAARLVRITEHHIRGGLAKASVLQSLIDEVPYLFYLNLRW